MREGLAMSYFSLLNFWLLIDSRGGGIIAFSFAPIGETTWLQCIVLNLWSHRLPWLNNTKPKGVSVRKRPVLVGDGE